MLWVLWSYLWIYGLICSWICIGKSTNALGIICGFIFGCTFVVILWSIVGFVLANKSIHSIFIYILTFWSMVGFILPSWWMLSVFGIFPFSCFYAILPFNAKNWVILMWEKNLPWNYFPSLRLLADWHICLSDLSNDLRDYQSDENLIFACFLPTRTWRKLSRNESKLIYQIRINSEMSWKWSCQIQ